MYNTIGRARDGPSEKANTFQKCALYRIILAQLGHHSTAGVKRTQNRLCLVARVGHYGCILHIQRLHADEYTALHVIAKQCVDWSGLPATLGFEGRRCNPIKEVFAPTTVGNRKLFVCQSHVSSACHVDTCLLANSYKACTLLRKGQHLMIFVFKPYKSGVC